MAETEKKDIKLQEWIVRFDGQITHSEMNIESETYHNDLVDQTDNF